MQFFEHQDQARGRTTLLIVLFVLSVIILVGASAWTAHFVLALELEPGEPYADNHWSLVATAGVTTFGVIFLGSVYRTTQLSAGGVKVAETMGGTLVTAQSPDLLERRLVNVVEEMAIAAGLPAPPVYVMQQETGINAFAAGWSPDDAVIGVTKGALHALSRDQLQGVIAHEFSHILNRDCALNMRLLGVLHGIVLISVIGRILIRFGSTGGSSGSRKDAPFQFFVVGVVVWIFGSLGVLVARIIQSAVSRQREFLADASAVQFTRNPLGIAGALATIGSQTSELVTPRGAETSHMLISEPKSSFLGALDSHPPLFSRIKRVLPNWNGVFSDLATPEGSVTRALERGKLEPSNLERARAILSGMPLTSGELPTGALAGGVVLDHLGTSRERGVSLAVDPSSHAEPLIDQAARFLESIPPDLRQAAEEPFLSRALILAWILDGDGSQRRAQLALISRDPRLAEETENLARRVPTLDQRFLLPLFDVALGTTAALSEVQKAAFFDLVQAVCAQLSPQAFRGYCLGSLTLRRLNPRYQGGKIKSVLMKEAIEVTLGILAYQGHHDDQAAARAFREGAMTLGRRGAGLLLPARSAVDITVLDAALSTMLKLPATTCAQILAAAERIAASDGIVRPSEEELLRTLATCLGVAARPAFAS